MAWSEQKGVFCMPIRSEKQRETLQKNNHLSKEQTRECIRTALLLLMEQKPFSQITMTNIIQKSGVSRSGVYLNYKSKEDILLDALHELIAQIVSRLGNSYRGNWDIVFSVAQENRKTLQLLLEAGLEYELLKRMNAEVASTSEDSYYYALWNGMIFNALILWGKSNLSDVKDAKQQVEQSCKKIAELIQSGCVHR